VTQRDAPVISVIQKEMAVVNLFIVSFNKRCGLKQRLFNTL